MGYRPKTLRRMAPETRKVAHLINEIDSISRRLKNLLPEIASLEHDSRALINMNKIMSQKPVGEAQQLFEEDEP